eukprot:12574523-Alexandrium_andersonii.AAC.1
MSTRELEASGISRTRRCRAELPRYTRLPARDSSAIRMHSELSRSMPQELTSACGVHDIAGPGAAGEREALGALEDPEGDP